MPKVSIILTSFNHGIYISEAIESVLNQTFTDYELIILDDFSYDNSWEIISEYTDPRIKAFRSDESGQVVINVNNAISKLATGDLIAIHHSDDVWELDKLEKQVQFLDEHPDIGAVFTNTLAISEDSSPLRNEEHPYYKIFDRPNRSRYEWLRFFFVIGSALCHPSVLIRKVCYEDCGLYCSSMAQLPDFDMWIRLCMKYEIHILPDKLVKFRVRDNEANASGDRPETRMRLQFEFYKVLQNYRQIDSIEDLIKIFPTAAKYNRNEDTDNGLVLAMVALEQTAYPYKQLFGQELLFEAISNPERCASIKRIYKFDYKNFIAVTAQHDVFSQEALANQNMRIVDLDLQIVELVQVVKTRDKQVADLNDVVVMRDKQVADLNDVVAMRDKQVADLNDVVAMRDKQVADLNDVVAMRDKQVADLNDVVAMRDKQVADLNDVVAMRDKQVADLNDVVVMRDKQVAELIQVVDTRDKQVAELTQVVDTRDKQVEELSQILETRDKQIANLNQDLAAWDALNLELSEKNERIASLTKLIVERNELISNVYSSSSWRITGPLRFILRTFKGLFF